MNPTFWIAHILAFHLNVPEPITFSIGSTYPTDYKAMICFSGRPHYPDEWFITYDKYWWDKHNDKQRMFIIAHEVCHAVYEYDVNWNVLSLEERRNRHKIVDKCAKKIIRDHNHEYENDEAYSR